MKTQHRFATIGGQFAPGSVAGIMEIGSYYSTSQLSHFAASKLSHDEA